MGSGQPSLLEIFCPAKTLFRIAQNPRGYKSQNAGSEIEGARKEGNPQSGTFPHYSAKDRIPTYKTGFEVEGRRSRYG